MEDLIKRIIEIENDAQNVVRDARAAKENFEIDANAQVDEMRKQIDEQATHKIEQLEALEKNSLLEKAAQIEAVTQQKLQELESQYKEHASDWEDIIFNNVVGR